MVILLATHLLGIMSNWNKFGAMKDEIFGTSIFNNLYYVKSVCLYCISILALRYKKSSRSNVMKKLYD